MTDSLNKYLYHLTPIGLEDVEGLQEAHKSYGASCLKRGGAGIFMMLARKWDRLEKLLESGIAKTGETFSQWDVFEALKLDPRAEGVIDDIRDLRRYLMIVEAHARALGIESAQSKHRDNQPEDGIVGFPGQCILLDDLGDPGSENSAKDFISASLAHSEKVLRYADSSARIKTVPASCCPSEIVHGTMTDYRSIWAEKLGLTRSEFKHLEYVVATSETMATAANLLKKTLKEGGELIQRYLEIMDELPPLLNEHDAPIARVHQKLAYFTSEKPKAAPKVSEPRGFDPEQDCVAETKADPAIS